MHIVSNVEGRLAPQHDALSALIAGFPAGTVSGAPKVRAMQIIDELEVEKRGVYAGGVGYFAAQGDMDICIALRTGVVKDGTLYVQAGGGVDFATVSRCSASSARSSAAVAPRRRVPAIGRIVTVSPFTRTRISGLAPTTWKPPQLK